MASQDKGKDMLINALRLQIAAHDGLVKDYERRLAEKDREIAVLVDEIAALKALNAELEASLAPIIEG